MDIRISTELAPPFIEELLTQLDSVDVDRSGFPLAISTPAPELDPWDFLDANSGLERVVWSDRDSKVTTVGLGEAVERKLPPGGDIVDCFAECRRELHGHDSLRWYGGFSFDGTDGWNQFGAGRFLIPRLVLSRDQLTLAVMDADDVDQARQDLKQIRDASESLDRQLPAPVEKSYQPTFDGWQSRIDEALSLIRAEALEKIVLSRKTKLHFSESLNPIALAARLKEATHDCFVFCLDFGGSSVFVGATPERLFLRQNNQLNSEVVAGTRMRGRTDAEDERLAIELLTSDKDQREHDIVRKSIRQKLHKFVEHLDVDSQASILRLARKQHLRSSVRGTLKPGVDDSMLLERLHPTPAVGGYPTDNALPEIARLEPFHRGWYAAPVGWIGADSAHFAVAIRSGLVDGDTLSLYSGAGIVRGSDPDEEWQEVENKIQDYLNVLGR